MIKKLLKKSNNETDFVENKVHSLFGTELLNKLVVGVIV